MININQKYIVKKGDTLYGISNQFGVSVTELAEINGIKGSNLNIGEVLIIPNKSGDNPNNMFMYTVKDGDTLYGISRKYNTTVEEIINLNYLKNNIITPGMVIRIPEIYTKEEEMYMPNYINYIVKKGDTLYKIASEYGVSIDLIIKDNGLVDNNLKVGQLLRIRSSEEVDEIEECFGPSYTPPNNIMNIVNYTVKKGDNLYNIAKKYDTSVSNILSLNKLNSSNLSIGQVLKIPSSSNIINNNVYIVKKGDSLYSIANKYNTTIENIKKINKLTSNNLQIGDKLII